MREFAQFGHVVRLICFVGPRGFSAQVYGVIRKIMITLNFQNFLLSFHHQKFIFTLSIYVSCWTTGTTPALVCIYVTEIAHGWIHIKISFVWCLLRMSVINLADLIKSTWLIFSLFETKLAALTFCTWLVFSLFCLVVWFYSWLWNKTIEEMEFLKVR